MTTAQIIQKTYTYYKGKEKYKGTENHTEGKKTQQETRNPGKIIPGPSKHNAYKENKKKRPHLQEN